MLQRAVRFVHLTDLHVSPTPPGGTPKDDDPVARLDTALEMIRGIDPAPDFAIVSGDITDKGDEESYRIVRQRLEALAMPVVYALGNHDPFAKGSVIAPHHVGRRGEVCRDGGEVGDSQFAGSGLEGGGGLVVAGRVHRGRPGDTAFHGPGGLRHDRPARSGPASGCRPG